MAEARNDVIMCLFKDSSALDAESTSQIVATDKMTQGIFQAGKFFEIESFSLALKLRDDDKAGMGAVSGRTYEAWRAAKTDTQTKGKQLFYVLPEELTVVRDLDKASPALLQCCLTGDLLKRAVLVKRGRNSVGDLTGFMKMEFNDLRVRSVDWSDGDTVRETCKFKFAKFTVTYVVRKADGSTLSSVNATWAAQGESN